MVAKEIEIEIMGFRFIKDNNKIERIVLVMIDHSLKS